MEIYLITRSNSQSSLIRKDGPLKEARIEVNLNELESDPSFRKKISLYHSNDRDKVHQAYWLKSPTQPKIKIFSKTFFGPNSKPRKFNPSWYSEPNSYWLEYSEAKDAVYYLCCYLFRPTHEKQVGGNFFIDKGFRNWKKKFKLIEHVGCVNSAHYEAWSKCRDLVNQDQHIQSILFKQSSQAHSEYRTRLTMLIDCI